MSNDLVKAYTLSTCGHCKDMKKMLDECTIKYEYTDVDLLTGEEREDIINDLKKINPRCTFPTIIIGKKVFTGFREDIIREALGLA